ncbi:MULTISPECIES: entericidin [Burkholderiaceae]|nr:MULTISPECIES: entericidin [Burkholderiaceae]
MTRMIATILMLAGCNTVSGAGQGISTGGGAVTNFAEKAK